MTGMQQRLHLVRNSSARDVARLAYRKAIYRKVLMGRLGGRTGDSAEPTTPHGLELAIWGPDRYGEVLGTNPYLLEVDLEQFRSQDSKCVVALDGDRIVASSWMTSGEVFVQDLHRSVHVRPGEHFSCRSFVGPDYSGRSLMSHMIHAYASSVPPDDEVWGLLYPSNVASIRSCDRLGWAWSGDYWTTFLFGRKLAGERHFPKRPGMQLTELA
jgi:hypothetical protein